MGGRGLSLLFPLRFHSALRATPWQWEGLDLPPPLQVIVFELHAWIAGACQLIGTLILWFVGAFSCDARSL
jgi:hypothetical protein